MNINKYADDVSSCKIKVISMRKYLLSVVILVALSLALNISIQNATADKAELEKVKQAIKEKKVGWTADENTVSVIDEQHRNKKLGLIMDDVELAKVSAKKPKPVPPTPPTPPISSGYDWRNYGKVTPVKDQLQCGSCWAFGSLAAMESVYLITQNTSTIDLSEQELVSCATSCWGSTAGGCSGGYLSSAYNYIRDKGAINESAFPYKGTNLPCNNSTASRTKISSWKSISPDVDSLKAAVKNNPITAAFYVYTDFYYYKSGIYKYTYGKLEGGHAICIVGFDDTNGCFIVKNSWGTGWGELGYFKIAYSEIGSSVMFGRSAADFDMVSLAPPKMGSVVAAIWGQIKTE
jgi:C1A family cysteine protease